jgi:hypothetical protein
VLVDASVNCTVRGAFPLGGFAERAATGTTAAVVGVGVAVVGVGAGVAVVVTVVLSADADEVTTPRITRVRQKTRKKVFAFIYIPTHNIFVSQGPEAVVPDGSVPPFGAVFCPFLW